MASTSRTGHEANIVNDIPVGNSNFSFNSEPTKTNKNRLSSLSASSPEDDRKRKTAVHGLGDGQEDDEEDDEEDGDFVVDESTRIAETSTGAIKHRRNSKACNWCRKQKARHISPLVSFLAGQAGEDDPDCFHVSLQMRCAPFDTSTGSKCKICTNSGLEVSTKSREWVPFTTDKMYSVLLRCERCDFGRRTDGKV